MDDSGRLRLMCPQGEFTADRRGGQWTQWTLRWLPSKPLVGILGDVDGRIVPVAPPPVLNLASAAEPGGCYWPESVARRAAAL